MAMTKRDKLLAAIRAFGRSDEPDLLNFQNRGGYIPPYRARQLIRMMDRYGGEDDEVSD
jgi:hypothetical protein